ncbi:MAG: hypothetical protein H7Y13_03815 [Sphingobacteriaceae bacterium]|nr:hypothetical protein [Sphingobacteriaceae bacterium]
MLPTDIYGEKITLEETFHDLKYRLYRIITTFQPYEAHEPNVLESIEKYIFAYPPNESVLFLQKSLLEIEKVIETRFQLAESKTFEYLSFLEPIEPPDFQRNERETLILIIASELESYRTKLQFLKATLEEDINPQTKITPGNTLPFKQIKLSKKGRINEVTTLFSVLKNEGVIDTSIENLKKVIGYVFLDSDGNHLKQHTLNTYFNSSKSHTHSKKR